MKRALFCLIALLPMLLATGCGTAVDDGTLTVATTTYPLYLLTSAVLDGAEGISVVPIVNQSVACLHDYTLTVTDMKVLEGADVVLINGAGLEDFLDAALNGKPVYDCSEGVVLLTDEEGEIDPHIWMDPQRAALMVQNIASALADLDPDQAELYRSNAAACAQCLTDLAESCRAELEELSCRQLITFHEGFAYLADAMDLEILAAVEEESGSEASARELVHIVALIEACQIPAIFTEANGSTATASAIRRECGVEIYSLSMLMSGTMEYSEANCYEALFRSNIAVLKEALS